MDEGGGGGWLAGVGGAKSTDCSQSRGAAAGLMNCNRYTA